MLGLRRLIHPLKQTHQWLQAPKRDERLNTPRSQKKQIHSGARNVIKTTAKKTRRGQDGTEISERRHGALERRGHPAAAARGRRRAERAPQHPAGPRRLAAPSPLLRRCSRSHIPDPPASAAHSCHQQPAPRSFPGWVPCGQDRRAEPCLTQARCGKSASCSGAAAAEELHRRRGGVQGERGARRRLQRRWCQHGSLLILMRQQAPVRG